jgi:two-component sensor histidine kinase
MAADRWAVRSARPWLGASVLAVGGLAFASCTRAPERPADTPTSLADVTRMDRRALERGLAVDAEAVTVFHDPSWERLIVQQDGRCVAVDATGVDPVLAPGERIRVSGFTAFERNGPMIVLPRIARLAGAGERTWRRTPAGRPVLPEQGLDCLELQVRVRSVHQIDSEHLSLQASVDGRSVEGIVMDVANSALLRDGDTVVVRGAVETLRTDGGGPERWRIYLQGEGAFERIGGAPPAPPAAGRPRPAPAPLTGLLPIKMLSAADAARGLPVHVRGVVTGASARASGGAQEIILQDADCALYATTDGATEAATFGSLVELEGRTAPGAFAPIVVYSTLRVLGRVPPPTPLVATDLDTGLSARTENAWSVAKGVLRPNGAEFVVATGTSELPLFFFTGDAAPLQRLVDAEVEVSGVFAVIHRARRIVGYRLLVQHPDHIVVTRPAPQPDPPTVWPIAQLFTYWPAGRPLHRISVRGVVTGVFHPDRVYVDDGTAGVLCETAGRLPAVGATVTASGFLPGSGPEHRLTRVHLRDSGQAAAAAPPPARLTIGQVAGGDHDGRLLSMTGRLIARTRSLGREWLTLEADQHTISAVLELPAPTPAVEQLRIGSELRVTGVGEMDWDRTRVPPRVRAARVRLRSGADLEVLRAAPWWTSGRIAGLLATALALASISLVWSVSLRRQVGRQTRVIRAQMATLHEQSDDRERARRKLEQALDEQLSLLREVHHRVKNNLQAIIHLMEIERDRIADPHARALLDDLRERAHTMALVYEQLYQSPSVARVDMETYLEALGGRLQDLLCAGRRIDVDVDAAGVSLDVSQAMPCGLIVNELVTNAFKHAFPLAVRDRGRIRVTLSQTARAVRLEVADDGIGVSGERQRQGAVGLELVALWARHQLGGRLTMQSERGTTFTVEFEGS